MASGEVTEQDVVIVGAGPAGCAAGITLARSGFRVCVLDAATFPRDKVCGDALSKYALREVQALGAGDRVRSGPSARVDYAAAIFPDGGRITRHYPEPGSIVPRYHLDDALRLTLEASGARVVQNCRVTSLAFEADRVVGAQTKDHRWSAKLVIAADGYGSIGLRALGERTPRGRELAVSCTAYYTGVRFAAGEHTSDHYFEAELPYGYGWIFPAVNGVSNVGVYIRADAYARSSRTLGELLDDFVARHADRFAGADRVGKRRNWSLPIAPRSQPLVAPGLLLAGDAAGLVDPLSGEGIWQALFSGRVGARIAARALREQRSGPELWSELERAYRSECKRAILRPSQHQAWIQAAMDVVVSRCLYRNTLVRGALHWGYSRKD